MAERHAYETPDLVYYGSITACTFTTPGGNPKRGDPCYHIDKFDEMSGLSPSFCEGGEGELDTDPSDPQDEDDEPN